MNQYWWVFYFFGLIEETQINANLYALICGKIFLSYAFGRLKITRWL